MALTCRFFLTVFDYPTNLIFIIVQWTVIAIGVTLKSAQFKKFKKIHFVLYLILGWSGIAVLNHFGKRAVKPLSGY